MHCHRPGQPYEYKGQEFDGLIARRGERLCQACAEAAGQAEGIDIHVTDPWRGIDYVRNTVTDADLVTPIATAYRPEYADYRPDRRRKS